MSHLDIRYLNLRVDHRRLDPAGNIELDVELVFLDTYESYCYVVMSHTVRHVHYDSFMSHTFSHFS